MDYIDYSRQERLNRSSQIQIGANSDSGVFIVGCGGIGFWAALFLAMMGVKKFFLYDADLVDKTNINRLPLNPRWVGKSKALALKYVIRQLRPDTVIVVHRKHLLPDSNEFVRELTYSPDNKTVFDCTDNIRTQQAISSVCKRYNTKYIKMGYEGLDIGNYVNVNAWIDDDYTTGYRTAQSNVLSSVVAAAFGVLRRMYSTCVGDGDFVINMLELLMINTRESLGQEVNKNLIKKDVKYITLDPDVEYDDEDDEDDWDNDYDEDEPIF